MAGQTTFSKRLSKLTDSFFGSVDTGIKSFVGETLPVWAGEQLRVSQKDKLRQPTFNANVAADRIDGPVRKPPSRAAREAIRDTLPPPKGFLGIPGLTQNAAMGIAAIAIGLIVVASVVPRR